MKSILLTNIRAILHDSTLQNASILIKDSLIEKISTKAETWATDEIFDLTGMTVFPGFIDIHNHGAVGFDVNSASAEDLIEIAAYLASKGVTAWLPTLVPDSDENYKRAIDAIDDLMEAQIRMPIAQALGVHYEGVFANEKMCGALRPQFFKSFKDGNEACELPRLKKAVHFTTLAPEVENGIDLVRELRRQNWVVSIGHTKAEPEVLDEAYDAGARHLTHFFNAMTSLHHRDMGVAGWGLTKGGVSFDIIADGIHVASEMLKFAVENKSVEKVSLISDSVLPTGLGDGDYEVWNEKISVVDGKTKNERGSIAGSVITLLDAAELMLSLGFSEVEVSKMASLNPAKLLGVEGEYGSIEVGKRADLVAFDDTGNVKMTIVGGRIAEPRQ